MRFLRDVRFGLRLLRRQPSFACAAIAVMVLGVGATTAVFSLLRGVLITPLPYRDPGQLVLLRAQLPGSALVPVLTSIEFAALRAQTAVFDSVAAVVPSEGNLTAPEHMASMRVAAVSENFLDTLGVAPLLGRSVERGTAARRSIAISYEVWQRYFQGDPAVVGRLIDVDNASMTVAGVLPRGFKAYLGSDATVSPELDLLSFRSAGYDEDPFRGNVVFARLRRGVSIAAAGAALEAVARNLAVDHPDRYRTGPVRLSLVGMEDDVISGARPALVAAAGAVALVLIAACANLTNLLLARASGRTQEIAVRIAIGARRRDVLRQLLAEGLVIGVVGAAGGWMLAHGAVSVLLALAPAALPRRETVTVDGGIALFAIALALVCAVIVSLVPAWHATRPAISPRLTRHAARTRGILVAIQLALSVVLLVGAGLMARAFVSLRSVPLGFEGRQAVSMHIALDGQRFDAGTFEQARTLRRGFYEQLVDQVRDVSGVRAAGAGFPVPLSGITMSQRVSLGPALHERDVDGFIAFAGYLEALGVPLIAGRAFTRADNARPVVIVDEHLARQLWPGASAVGQRLLIVKSVSAPQWTEVVGLVAHVQARSPREPGPPQVWMTYGVRSYAQLDVLVRADDPMATVPSVVGTVQRLGTGRPVRDIRLLEDSVSDASADTRFALFVIGVLAVLAVLLAAVGIYGVVAYVMARRRREIAVRMALGGSPRRLVGLVLGESAVWTLAGLASGLAGAAAFTRTLEALLFRVGPHDALTFTAVACVLASIALAASAVPAWRAARVDPMLALRSE